MRRDGCDATDAMRQNVLVWPAGQTIRLVVAIRTTSIPWRPSIKAESSGMRWISKYQPPQYIRQSWTSKIASFLDAKKQDVEEREASPRNIVYLSHSCRTFGDFSSDRLAPSFSASTWPGYRPHGINPAWSCVGQDASRQQG